jgi:hypothetical protein
MNTQTNIVYISFGLLSCFSLYTYFQLQQTLDECQHKLDQCINDLEDTHKTLYNVFKIQELTYRQINTVIDTLNKKPNPIPKPIGEPEPIGDANSDPIEHPDDLFEELSHYYVTVDVDDTNNTNNADTKPKPTFIKSAKNLFGL